MQAFDRQGRGVLDRRVERHVDEALRGGVGSRDRATFEVEAARDRGADLDPAHRLALDIGRLHGLLGSGIELGSFPVSATKVRDKADELALRPACRSQGNEQPFGIPPEAGPVGSFPNVRHSPHILRLMIARFSANGAANAVRFAQRLLRDRPAGALRPIRGRRLENELSGEGKPPKNPMRPSLGRWSSG
ncbi:MAG: hypothetical protein WCE83_13375 [Candidatus Baltobacteraceae bacterium]